MVTNLYFYAEKYEVEDLKRTLVTQFYEGRPITVTDAETCLLMARKYNNQSWIASLDAAKLDLRMENVLEFWTIASENRLDRLMDQVAKFLYMKPCDRSWPIEMMDRVLIMYRKEFGNELQRIQQSATETRWCCTHRGQARYKPVIDCLRCSELFDNSVPY